MIWCAAFLLIALVWYFPSKQDGTAYQEVQTRILTVIFLVFSLFLFSDPKQQRVARVAIVFATLVGVGINIYELFNPMTFSRVLGRSAGLFRDSNQSGGALLLGLILGYQMVPSRLRGLFIFAVGLGVFTTFSRSAMLGWILIVLYFAARNGFGFRQFRNAVLLTAVVLGFLYSPLWTDLQTSFEQKGLVNLDTLQRISFFQSGSTGDESADERKLLAEAGWRMVRERPYFGYGTGAFRVIPGFDQSTHNIYIAMAIDHGVFGLLLMPSLVLAAVWGAPRQLLDITGPWTMFMLMWGFFSHNELEERHILLSAALVSAMVISARAAKRRAARMPSDLSLAKGMAAA
jgi:O-antigen ligase